MSGEGGKSMLDNFSESLADSVTRLQNEWLDPEDGQDPLVVAQSLIYDGAISPASSDDIGANGINVIIRRRNIKLGDILYTSIVFSYPFFKGGCIDILLIRGIIDFDKPVIGYYRTIGVPLPTLMALEREVARVFGKECHFAKVVKNGNNDYAWVKFTKKSATYILVDGNSKEMVSSKDADKVWHGIMECNITLKLGISDRGGVLKICPRLDNVVPLKEMHNVSNDDEDENKSAFFRKMSRLSIE